MSFVQQHKKSSGNTVGACCFTQWLAWQVIWFTQLPPYAIYDYTFAHLLVHSIVHSIIHSTLCMLCYSSHLCAENQSLLHVLPLFFTLSRLSLPESTLTHLHAHCHFPDHHLACSRNSFCWQGCKECRGLTSGMLGMWQLDSPNFSPASAARLFWTMNPNTVAHSWQRRAAYPSTVSLYGCWPKIL